MEVIDTGIYEILNTENGKWYRGQTIEGFDVRFHKHRWSLNRGEGVNEHLQRAWDKYGEEAFTFSVLSRCAPEFCNELEEYWIGDDYKDSDVSYNKQAGGKNNLLSEDTKRKMSKSQKIAQNRPDVKRRKSETLKISMNRPETIRKRRESQGHAFTCTWPDGRVKHYLSTREAADELGVGNKSIWKYLKGKSTPGFSKKTAHLKGCVFAYCNT
jgi:group I intron endonuclease